MLDDPLRDVAQLDVVRLRLTPQEVERAIGVEVEALHEDALRLADELAGVDRDLQAGLVVGVRQGDGGMAYEDRGDRDVVLVERVGVVGVEVE